MNRDQLRASLERHLALPLSRLLEGSIRSERLTEQIVDELAEVVRLDDSGRAYAPDQFTLSLHPLDQEAIEARAPRYQQDISRGMNQSLEHAGLALQREAHITVATDPTLRRGEIRLIAWHSSDPLHLRGTALETAGPSAPGTEQIPAGAFLVVGGRRHFRLEASSVTIGRLAANDLVLEDGHVSRRHAQIRASKGQFILKDLESTSGMRVNGRRVREHRLKPGDVILLGETELIYGQDLGGPPELTPPYAPEHEPGERQDQVTPFDIERRATDKLPRKDKKK